MPGYPYMKIYVEILDDVKMAELDDAQKWRFIQLILLAGECDAGGALVTGDSRMTHAQLSWRLRCDKAQLEKDIQKMLELGLIFDDEALTITKFEERQGPSQDAKRKLWRERQNKRRERIRKSDNSTEMSQPVTEVSRVTHANVTGVEKEKEKEEDKEKETEKDTSGVGVVFSRYEKNVGALTSAISDKLNVMLDDYPVEWIVEAIEIAVQGEKRNLRYIEGILRNWKQTGKSDTKKAKTKEKTDYSGGEYAHLLDNG